MLKLSLRGVNIQHARYNIRPATIMATLIFLPLPSSVINASMIPLINSTVAINSTANNSPIYPELLTDDQRCNFAKILQHFITPTCATMVNELLLFAGLGFFIPPYQLCHRCTHQVLSIQLSKQFSLRWCYTQCFFQLQQCLLSLA